MSPPPDAPADWKPLIGSYAGADGVIFDVLERDGRLELKQAAKPPLPLLQDADGQFSVIGNAEPPVRLHFVLGEHDTVKEVIFGDAHLERRNYTDAGKSFRVTPARPLDELHREALLASPPREARSFRKPELVDLAALDPAIHLDIRYATTNNFLGAAVYTQARASLQRPAALALIRALHTLEPLGYGLLIHDGYRPWYVTKIFWEATPPEGKIFVADPAEGSRHNRGCAVDLTLYDLKTGAPIEMPGTYDEMSPRSFPDYPGGTTLQRWHRDLLRRVMESEGFTVYESEWWHFDYKDWREYPVLNTPFEQLDLGPAETTSADGTREPSALTLTERIQRVTSRPEFAHANFGIEFYSLDSGKVVYALNADKLFVPASTTKILTEGTLLAKLGADYRFHTRVYRSGPVDSKGKLKGDLILVASGDPNLSNRIQADGTLAFVDEDHSYNGPALSGDALAVIKELAGKIAAGGIKKIDGRLLIDTSLFPDGGREGGTDVVMSSIMVNDNVIDLVWKPGMKAGDLTALESSPHTSYVKFVNHVTTGPENSKPNLNPPEIVSNEDGSVAITLSGSLPLGMAPQTAAFAVPSPTTFSLTALREALIATGVRFKGNAVVHQPDFAAYTRFYVPGNEVAEHVSPPLSEEIKVTLKVSQNLHASMGPYFLGTLVAKDVKNPLDAGFKIEREFLQSANLDLSGASQGDGAGGDWADLFTPDFIVHYLAYWTTRLDYPIFFKALPVLGKDGTLANIQKDSAGAGHVFAKTGTFESEDKLNAKGMLNGKGLAGYVITKKGEKLAFAAYVNHVSLPNEPDVAQRIAGQALGEIAAAAYDAALQ